MHLQCKVVKISENHLLQLFAQKLHRISFSDGITNLTGRKIVKSHRSKWYIFCLIKFNKNTMIEMALYL